MTTGPRRCLLFVPGNRPERFEKAIATGADMVCIDLEDAVAPSEKSAARAAAVAFANSNRYECELVIRTNAPGTAWGLEDLRALRAVPANVLVMLAKVETPHDVEIATTELGVIKTPPRLIALLESAFGIENAFQIAANPALCMLMLGGADYCAQLGAVMNEASLAYPRARLAAACAAHGLIGIDVPFLDTQDQSALQAETAHIAAMGIACKSAIHPNQVATIQSQLTPSAAEISKAKRIVEGFANSPHAALLIDGKLVDRPIVLAAERVLLRARQGSL